MYLIGIYLIGTQRAASCQQSLARENSTACRSQPWPGSSSAGSSGWCRRKVAAVTLRGLTRSAPAALHLPRPRNTRRQVQAHLRSRVRHAARKRPWRSVISEAMPTQRPARKTYRQNWPAYNAAQTHEKAKFQELLSELCSDIKEPVRSRNGRPRLPIHDAIFCCLLQGLLDGIGAPVHDRSARGAREGLHRKTPHFNTIFNYLEDKNLTPILRELITRSSLPLKAVETDFAVDFVGLQHQPVCPLVRSEVRSSSARARLGEGASDVRCAHQRRHGRRNPRPARCRHQIAALLGGHDCRELRAARSVGRQGLRQRAQLR